MKRGEKLESEIKVRCATWLRKNLEAIAIREDLELSDIVRRALKAYAINPASR